MVAANSALSFSRRLSTARTLASEDLRVGAHTAYKKLLKFKNIEGVESGTTLDTSVLKYKRVRELFTEFENYKIESIPYCGSPDYEKLLAFLLKHKVWYDTRRSSEANVRAVESRLEKLKAEFAATIVVFEEGK